MLWFLFTVSYLQLGIEQINPGQRFTSQQECEDGAAFIAQGATWQQTFYCVAGETRDAARKNLDLYRIANGKNEAASRLLDGQMGPAIITAQ